MFILTLDESDPMAVGERLQEILQEIQRNRNVGCIGHTPDGTRFEYDFLSKQKWIHMSSFLQWNVDGNTLRPV